MRQSWLPLLLGIVFVAIVAQRQGGRVTAPAAGTPAEQALAVARAAHQPVVLSFRSESCIPCQDMARIVAALRVQYAGRAALVDVSLAPNSPEQRLIAQYRVHAKPTTVLLTADGRLVANRIGVWPATELRRRLDGLVRR